MAVLRNLIGRHTPFASTSFMVRLQTFDGLCRAVYVAIPVCVAGVVLITQPSFLGKHSQQRSTLGILLAVGQVRMALTDAK